MLTITSVSKEFIVNNKRRNVINDINLAVQKGEVFGLVGGTGSGKSTILRLMNGFITPDQGSITLMEQPLTQATRKTLVKDTAMIFQGFNLLKNLTVLENIRLPAKLRGVGRKESLAKTRALLEFVGLEDFESSYIRPLSGGQKQRVAIARTLITQPKLILCDEPTSALDEKMSYEILKLLKKINEELGTTIVMVSHNISVIKALCHQVAIIEEGRVREVVICQREPLKPISYREALAR